MRAPRLALATLCLALVAAACSPPGVADRDGRPSPGGTGAAACPAAPGVPDGPRRAGAARARRRRSSRSSSPARPARLRPEPGPVHVPRRGRTGRSARRTDPPRSRSTTSAATPTTPIATVDGTFVWAIEDERGDLRRERRRSPSGPVRRRVHDRRGGRAAETIRLTFDVQPSSPVVKVGDKAPASKTPTLADVGGDVSQHLDRRRPRPRVLRDLGRRGARRPQAVRARSSRRRSSARAPSAARRSTGSSPSSSGTRP